MVKGNEDAIRQIILNLICNAIRHTPAGGTVEVAAQRPELRHGAMRGIVKCARHAAAAFPRALVGQIFEAGFSGSGETPGLGLAVCQRLDGTAPRRDSRAEPRRAGYGI